MYSLQEAYRKLLQKRNLAEKSLSRAGPAGVYCEKLHIDHRKSSQTDSRSLALKWQNPDHAYEMHGPGRSANIAIKVETRKAVLLLTLYLVFMELRKEHSACFLIIDRGVGIWTKSKFRPSHLLFPKKKKPQVGSPRQVVRI